MLKKIITIIIIICIIIFGFVGIKLYSKEKGTNQMIGILKEGISNPETEFLGSYSKKKESSKFAGYIMGEDLQTKNIPIAEDFKADTINIFNIEVKYPSFFYKFSPVEVSDGVINLIATDPTENRLYKNSLIIGTQKVDKDYTLEKFKNQHSSEYSSTTKLENYKIEGNKITMNLNLNYKTIGYENYKDIKEYIYAELKDNTVYYVQYIYDNPTIGNKAIDLINSSFKIIES